jgi:hypothetical protein
MAAAMSAYNSALCYQDEKTNYPTCMPLEMTFRGLLNYTYAGYDCTSSACVGSGGLWGAPPTCTSKAASTSNDNAPTTVGTIIDAGIKMIPVGADQFTLAVQELFKSTIASGIFLAGEALSPQSVVIDSFTDSSDPTGLDINFHINTGATATQVEQSSLVEQLTAYLNAGKLGRRTEGFLAAMNAAVINAGLDFLSTGLLITSAPFIPTTAEPTQDLNDALTYSLIVLTVCACAIGVTIFCRSGQDGYKQVPDYHDPQLDLKRAKLDKIIQKEEERERYEQREKSREARNAESSMELGEMGPVPTMGEPIQAQDLTRSPPSTQLTQRRQVEVVAI